MFNELGHVIQQKRSILRPTCKVKEVCVNDDKGLEKEADTINAKTVSMIGVANVQKMPIMSQIGVLQQLRDVELHTKSAAKLSQTFLKNTEFMSGVHSVAMSTGVEVIQREVISEEMALNNPKRQFGSFHTLLI